PPARHVRVRPRLHRHPPRSCARTVLHREVLSVARAEWADGSRACAGGLRDQRPARRRREPSQHPLKETSVRMKGTSMIEKPVAFFSEGSKLQGPLYLPESASPDRPHPAVVVNSGYQGFNEFYPRMFAQKLTEYGYICLGFDYRGMADSEGQPGRVLIEEQVQDVRNAVTFIQTQDGVDAGRIGLLGWGMGAANVVIAAERAKSVSAVAALNGFYDGERWLKSIHSYERWNAILDEVNADRTHRVLEGNSQLADTFVHYPLDVQTRDYVEAELASLYGFGRQTRLQF